MRDLRVLLLGCAVCGAFLGFSHEEWQMALESAQVQAELVPYPPDNSFFMYHLKLWTLLVQLPALLLHFGFSDATVNAAICMLMGSLLYTVQGLTCFILSRNINFSLTLPAAIWVTRMFMVGNTYEIMLYNEPHTFGIVAPAFGLLLFQLQALQQYRLAALLLGIAPALHPTVGLWTLGVSGARVLVKRELRQEWRVWGPWFGLGVVGTLWSYGVHLTLAAGLPTIDPQEARRYLEAFTSGWDMHRRPVVPTSLAALLALLLVGMVVTHLGAGALRMRRTAGEETLPPAAGAAPRDSGVLEGSDARLLEILGLSAVFALGWAILSHLQSWLPAPLISAMPWRNINITGLAFPFVLTGLLLRSPEQPHRQGLLLTLVISFQQPLFWSPAPFRGAWVVIGTCFLLSLWMTPQEQLTSGARRARALGMLGLALGIGWVSTQPAWYRLLFPEIRSVFDSWVPACCVMLATLMLTVPLPRGSGRILRGLSGGLVGLLVLNAGVNAGEAILGRRERLSSSSTDALLAKVAQAPGVLVTASNLTRIQVRTRRPVLLHGYNLNVLPYVLESAPAMQKALTEVYGLSLFQLPGLRAGGMDSEDGRDAFETRTEEGWQRLEPELHITQVLTPKDWELKLPLVIEDHMYRLWQIPPR